MERQIVLLGKTGSGKSAAGNTILKDTYFEVKFSSQSVTDRCEVKEVGCIKVIDTPGMFDTSLSSDQLKREISRCVDMSLPGPHVFLLVIKLGRFTEEEKNAVEWIQENFGEDASLYTIVLFTYTDQLGEQTLDEFVSESQELRRILRRCGNRYHAFNNNNTSPSQVENLMQKIDDLITKNGGKCYTNEMYENAQINKNNRELKKTVAAAAGVGAALTAAAVAAAGVGAVGAGGAALTGVAAAVGGVAAAATGGAVVGVAAFVLAKILRY